MVLKNCFAAGVSLANWTGDQARRGSPDDGLVLKPVVSTAKVVVSNEQPLCSKKP
jgi:hypothetical protein